MNAYEERLSSTADLDEARRSEALRLAVSVANARGLEGSVVDAAKAFEKYLKGDGGS